MRILLTTDTVGGVWTFTKELSQQLLKKGHNVALVSFGRTPSADQVRWMEALSRSFPSSFCFESTAIPLEWMQNNELAYDQGVEVLEQVASMFQPDILHTNQFCFGCLPIDVPKLVTAHSDVLSWAAACRSEGLEQSPWLERYRTAVQRGLREAALITAPTQWIAGELGRHFDLPSEVEVIANGRDVSPPHTLVPRTFCAVSVGRLWDEAKGLAIVNELDDCAIPIVIAGDECFEKASAPSLGQTCVQSRGVLKEEDLFELYRHSTVYLATAVYEPFGYAPLEAALCGCAVLARDIPSLREVWKHAALYFTDATSLHTQLLSLQNNSEFLGAMQAAALRQALTYSSERMADAYLACYARAGEQKPFSSMSVAKEMNAEYVL